MFPLGSASPPFQLFERFTYEALPVSDPKQLPHLLKLLDDESEKVREAVARALGAFGPSLDQELARLPQPLDEEQMQKIQYLLGRHRSEETESLFEPGQLVRHRKYDYRGVVVAFDLTCQADDDWYFSNRSQPQQYQPWYHVLVHGGQHVTYAAQTSLEQDNSGEQVVHPFIAHFFSTFSDGQYSRNDKAWPG